MKALSLMFALLLCGCASDAIFHEVVDVECQRCHARPQGLKPIVRVSQKYKQWTRVMSDYECPNCQYTFRRFSLE